MKFRFAIFLLCLGAAKSSQLMAPLPPAVVAPITNYSLTLSWSAPPNLPPALDWTTSYPLFPTLKGYNVYCGYSSGNYFITNFTTETTMAFNFGTNSTRPYLAVGTVCNDGNEWARSSEIMFKSDVVVTLWEATNTINPVWTVYTTTIVTNAIGKQLGIYRQSIALTNSWK